MTNLLKTFIESKKKNKNNRGSKCKIKRNPNDQSQIQ
jgi:hypothetical protein